MPTLARDPYQPGPPLAGTLLAQNAAAWQQAGRTQTLTSTHSRTSNICTDL